MKAFAIVSALAALGCMEGERATFGAAGVVAARVYVASGFDGTLSIVSPETSAVTGTLDLVYEAGGKAWMVMLTDVAVAPDRRSVWAIGTSMAMTLPAEGVQNAQDMTPPPALTDAIQDQVVVIDPSMDMIVARIPIGKGVRPSDLAFNPSSETVFVAAKDDLHVFAIDVASYAVVEHFDLPPGHDPVGIAWCEGKLHVASRDAKAVTALDPGTGDMLDTPVGGAVVQTACAKDVVLATLYDTREVVSIKTANVVTRIALPASATGPIGVTASPDAALAYVADAGGQVFVLDLASASVVATIAVGKAPRGVAASVDRIFVTNGDDGTVSVIDAHSRAIVATVAVGKTPNGVALLEP